MRSDNNTTVFGLSKSRALLACFAGALGAVVYLCLIAFQCLPVEPASLVGMVFAAWSIISGVYLYSLKHHRLIIDNDTIIFDNNGVIRFEVSLCNVKSVFVSRLTGSVILKLSSGKKISLVGIGFLGSMRQCYACADVIQNLIVSRNRIGGLSS